MFRWAVAGIAVFVGGMAAGGLVHYQLMAPASPGVRTPSQIAAPTAPAAAASAKPVAPERPAVLRPTAAPEPAVERGRQENLIKPAVATRPSAGEVLVVAVKPDRQTQARWGAAAPATAQVKIARVRTTSSTLRDNPIVQRELTRDIQQELYRVGCHSVVVSGRWDARTVKASTQFVANRNAVLPADRPDVILLSLLRGYRGGDCGKSQELANTGPTLVAPNVTSSAIGRPAAVVQPSIGPTVATGVRRPASAPGVRTTQRRKRSSARRKRANWRNRVHYGTGSDY